MWDLPSIMPTGTGKCKQPIYMFILHPKDDPNRITRWNNTWHTSYPHHMYFYPIICYNNICNSHFEHYYLHVYEDHYQKTTGWTTWKFLPEIASPLDLSLFQRLREINPRGNLQKSGPTTYDNNPTLMRNLLKTGNEPFWQSRIKRHCIKLLSHFPKYARLKWNGRQTELLKALWYIHKHIAEGIELKKKKKTCGIILPFQRPLYPAFQKGMGTTPLQYVNQKR